MKHRQDGHAAVEDGLAVGGNDSVFHLFLVSISVLPPVGPGPLLADVGLAAGGVRADVRLAAMAAASLQFINGIGPGGHRLGLQGFLLKGGGHFRTHHTHEIGAQVHLLHGVAAFDLQDRPAVQITAGERLALCLVHRRLPGQQFRAEGNDDQQRQDEQHRQKRRRHGDALPDSSFHRSPPLLHRLSLHSMRRPGGKYAPA